MTLTRKLIADHLAYGDMTVGNEIGLRIDQTLASDATGTLLMLALEALELDRTRAELSVQYVDHNLLQGDERNADDHLFLRSAARRFGAWYSGPRNGESHPVHQRCFGKTGPRWSFSSKAVASSESVTGSRQDRSTSCSPGVYSHMRAGGSSSSAGASQVVQTIWETVRSVAPGRFVFTLEATQGMDK